MLTTLLVAAGLSMDNFAVSLAAGCTPNIKPKNILSAALAFVVAHIVMFSLGWFGGAGVGKYIHAYDHWVAFGLLFFISVKMLKEAFFSKEEACANITKDLKTICLIAIATSIDAFAVGLSLSFLDFNFVLSVSCISFFVFLTTVLGFKLGSKFGDKFGKKAEVFGGLVLLVIAVKILLDGLK
ncbi:putative Mn2+ efflux pump MntP [Elusimicrobium posterum]|uniref:manganese efflux pump MntP n=1 Tax=Elusimicrobium posterum TaxID=3116653 RepID=UPI003C73477A